MEVERELIDKYRDPALCELPPELQKRGGAYYSMAAVDLMRSIVADDGARHIVNVRNAGTIPALPHDCVVEINCEVDAAGAHPLPRESPAPEIRGLMQRVKAYEELAVEAAVFRSREKAIMALVAHPLVGDAELSVQLVDEIAAEHGIEFDEGGRERR